MPFTSAQPRISGVRLEASWEAVLNNEVEWLFSQCGDRNVSCVVIEDSTEFKVDIYTGEQLSRDPVLSAVLSAAAKLGYGGPDHRKDKGAKLKQGILVLSVNEDITATVGKGRAFWLQKYTSTITWTCLDIQGVVFRPLSVKTGSGGEVTHNGGDEVVVVPKTGTDDF